MLFFRKEFMLGYIKPDKPDLKIREFEIYGGYYCGICKSIGRRYGQFPRLALSYDSVFLAILIGGIQDEKETIKQERCIVHPLKKRTIVSNSEAIDYAADVLLLLAYYKLKDDYQDDKSIKAAIGLLFSKGSIRKLRSKLPSQCDYVKRKLDELSMMESNQCDSIDQAAEPFAKIMEELLAFPGWVSFQEEKVVSLYRRIGYHLGKWIYLIDAYDDIEDNIKDHGFNPLLLQFEFEQKKETAQIFKERIKERIEMNLILYLAEIAKACDQLDLKKNQGLIENIIYFGLMRQTEDILKKGNLDHAESI